MTPTDPCTASAALTPPEQPLAMPEQDFAVRFQDSAAPAGATDGNARNVAIWRILAFSPAMAATGLLTWGMKDWFAADGFSALEVVLLVLIAFNFFWISFSVSAFSFASA